MRTLLNENWWFARVAIHPVPGGIRLQWRLAALVYVLLVGVPALADLILNEGAYNYFDASYIIPSICTNVAFLVLTFYFIRADGSSWQLFWNEKFVPNLICLLLTAVIFFFTQEFVQFFSLAIIANFPKLSPYFSGATTYFQPKFLVPMTLATICCQEIFLRAFLLTRIRQSGVSLLHAVLWSAVLYGIATIGWGIDLFVAAVIAGIFLGLTYARWGGLAGVILGRLAWDLSRVKELSDLVKF